jgi:hypothetical protein
MLGQKFAENGRTKVVCKLVEQKFFENNVRTKICGKMVEKKLAEKW